MENFRITISAEKICMHLVTNGENLLEKYAPGMMVYGGIYENENNHLPSAPGRVWYEADINYYEGQRNRHRIVWSNDGLIFVTYDHYHTFYEIT